MQTLNRPTQVLLVALIAATAAVNLFGCEDEPQGDERSRGPIHRALLAFERLPDTGDVPRTTGPCDTVCASLSNCLLSECPGLELSLTACEFACGGRDPMTAPTCEGLQGVLASDQTICAAAASGDAAGRSRTIVDPGGDGGQGGGGPGGAGGAGGAGGGGAGGAGGEGGQTDAAPPPSNAFGPDGYCCGMLTCSLEMQGCVPQQFCAPCATVVCEGLQLDVELCSACGAELSNACERG